ncbi:MAG TPA: peptidylprolyl isomerase [Verrucomicrobia bacterium]|nr:peptidylprolyl isomerase [Verrucomicrobiota bacterium]
MEGTQFMRTTIAWMAVMLNLAILSSALQAQDAMTLADVDTALPAVTVAAKVNDTEIPAARLERAVTAILRQNRGAQPSDEQLQNLRKSLLDRLIGIELLYQKAKSTPYPGLTEDVQKQIDQTIESVGGEERLGQVLEANNVTLEQLRSEMTKDLVIRNYIDTQIRPSIQVTDEDVSAFYNDNLEQMAEPERVQARHILLRITPEMTEDEKAAVRTEMEAIKKQLDDGADFEALAKEHSVDITSAKKGGDLGYFTRGQMVPPFEEAAFSLPIGQVSDVVETQFGFHLVKVDDHKEARTVPLEEVREQIVSALENQKAADKTDALVADLKTIAKIEILDPDVKEFSARPSATETEPAESSEAPAE